GQLEDHPSRRFLLTGFWHIHGSNAFKTAIDNDANEVMFGYSVIFENGFRLNKSGKPPGASSECSSPGRQAAGGLYTYLPPASVNSTAQLAVPGTIANDDYNFSAGRGSFVFSRNAWVAELRRVKMNKPGYAVLVFLRRQHQ
ncbi:hypothetical protein M0805_002163, partial [Coniferiporia weirii]